MNEDQILDQPLDDDEKRKDVLRNLAGGGKRFANYIIDIIMYLILVFVIGIVAGGVLGLSEREIDTLSRFSFLIFLFYYWVMESLTGKTVGKYITRTRVVKEDGSHPNGANILGRTICRLIPFEAFSFLGSPGKGWHDSIPKIYVIEEK